jgi:hypothetical protein
MNIFLDDFRHPYDAFHIWKDTDFLKLEWVIVRSHQEFVDKITTEFEKGNWPSLISIDHDLHPEHYEIGENANFQKFDYSLITVPTGLQSAEWLIEFCKDNKLEMPAYKVHSQNTIGRKNITAALESFCNKI